MEEQPKIKYYENVAKTIIKNLSKRQIEGYYCRDRESAVQKALELMPKGASVAWRGSVTIYEMGLIKAIKNANYKVINREVVKDSQEERKINAEVCLADFF